MDTLDRLHRPWLAATAVLILAQGALQAFVEPSGNSIPYTLSTTHLVEGVLGILAFAAAALSVVLVVHRSRGGLVPMAVALLAFVWLVLAAGAQWLTAFADPVFAQFLPALYTSDQPPPTLMTGFLVTFFGLGIVLAIFGVTLLVGGRVPRVPAGLFALGALATAVPADGPWSLVGTVLIAVAIGWWAVRPVRGTTPDREREPQGPVPAAA